MLRLLHLLHPYLYIIALSYTLQIIIKLTYHPLLNRKLTHIEVFKEDYQDTYVLMNLENELAVET